MEFFDRPLLKKEIEKLQRSYGVYIKLTIDIKRELVVAGCVLHADGEKILLDKGSRQNDIWGGGLDLENKVVDTSAVLNIRPKLGNDNLEILDSELRKKFILITNKFFSL